jgi:aminopeptidase
MKDKRLSVLAKSLVVYSTAVKPGDKVLVESKGAATAPLVEEIITEVAHAGGLPFWYFNDEHVERRWILGAGEQQLKDFGKMHLRMMKDIDCYISVRGADNSYTLADVPSQRMGWYRKYFYKPVHLEQRVKRTRWVVMRYPNEAMSQLAETSRESFEDFYFSVCNIDYAKMSKAMDPLVDLLKKTDKIRLVGPGTDLTFSVKGIPPVKCDGHRNIPDGEVYTAPVRTSINGVISYNTPSLNESVLYEGIRFEFKNGKIVKADCAGGNGAKLNKVLDIDPGARYVGEFALGIHPNIKHPMRDTLFDEKIFGSIHLTPGQCYDEAPNGNKSSIHWDLVLIQTKEYGGGEVYFDDVLIRKDGIFVHPALKELLSARALRGGH